LADGTATLGQSLVDHELHGLRVGKEPSLESCGHM
jgi:hypothetical protein